MIAAPRLAANDGSSRLDQRDLGEQARRVRARVELTDRAEDVVGRGERVGVGVHREVAVEERAIESQVAPGLAGEECLDGFAPVLERPGN